MRFNKNDVFEIIKNQIKNIDIIGISGLITTFEYQKWLISAIRSLSINIPIICGGGCASACEDLLLSYGATKIIKGEGENKLLEYLAVSKRYTDINDMPFPDYDNIDMNIYLKNPIWGIKSGNASNVGIHPDMRQKCSINMITSRGCPYSCNFCYDLFGKKYRQRSVSNIMQEIQLIKSKWDIDFIGFLDDNMFVNKNWVLEFCDSISKFNILWGCHARVNEIDNKILKSAYKSGCRWIGYGIESGSQSILNNMNKNIRIKQNAEAIELTRKNNIYPNTSFIYGYPGENKETIEETISFCKNLNIKPNFFYATPYPLTTLFNTYKHKIIAMFGGFENFVKTLGEAKDYSINLTSMTDNKYFKLKNYLEKSIS